MDYFHQNEFYSKKTNIFKIENQSNVNVDRSDEGQTIGQYDVEKDNRRRQPDGKLTQREDKRISIL
jgi:hypothetical protein